MNNEIYKLLMTPFFITCKTTGMQACHLCEREDCCDNDNPLVMKIKRLEKELKNLKEQYEKSN